MSDHAAIVYQAVATLAQRYRPSTAKYAWDHVMFVLSGRITLEALHRNHYYRRSQLECKV